MSVASTRRIVGGYELLAELASGGMASVYLGQCLRPDGPTGLVAIKRLHEHLARDPAFANVLLQEARITARIHHPNVVETLDVISADRELLLVMEYVQGETVARLLRSAAAGETSCSVEVAASIARDTLRGLHAAHETTDEHGVRLDVVHRDVSPQNIIVAAHGAAKVLDFGVAKAVGSLVHTRTGEVKGKVPYMAPEILALEPATPQTDVWAVAVVLWEMLCARRLFKGDSEATTLAQVLHGPIVSPREILGRPTALDEVVMRGLARDPKSRYATAAEMADAIEHATAPASADAVAAWVDAYASHELATRRQIFETLQHTIVMTRRLAPTPGGAATPQDVAPKPVVTAAPETSRRGRAAWGALVMMVLALALALAWQSTHAASKEVRVAPPPTPQVPPAPEASAAPIAVDSSEPSAVASVTAATSARPRPVVRAPTRLRGPSCEPPYTVDANGRKIFKLECIK